MLTFQTKLPIETLEGWTVPAGWIIYSSAKMLDSRNRSFWVLGKPGHHVLVNMSNVEPIEAPTNFVALEGLVAVFLEGYDFQMKRTTLSRARAIDVAIAVLMTDLPDWSSQATQLLALTFEVNYDLAVTVGLLLSTTGPPPYDAGVQDMDPEAFSDLQNEWREMGVEPMEIVLAD